MSEIIWKPVPKDGFSDFYEVSNSGLVRGLDRRVYAKDGRIFNLKSRILKPSADERGYLGLALSNQCQVTFKVHRLVALAFVPNPENLPEVNHIDGNKHNNWDWNLAWCTGLDNIRHAWDIGLFNDRKGIKNGRCKLTEEIVKKIRSEYIFRSVDANCYTLSAKYNISKGEVSEIVNNKIWKHI